MDFDSAGLLDGLEGNDRDERRRLLQRLCDDGFTLEQLREAVAEDRLALLAVEEVLGGTYTAAEIEERTGLPTSVLERLRRMLGLPAADPADRCYGEADVATAESTRRFLDAGLSERAIAELTRVLGESMARLAATTASAFVESFLKPGDSEWDVATRFATLTEEFIPGIQPVLMAAYTAHLREAVRRGMLGRAEREAGALADAQDTAVCFADLVGFTRMGVQVEAQELGGLAGRLAEIANEVTEPPVRLIKTIGDAAMFVSPDPAPLVGVALALVQAMQEADTPSVRAGVAFGPALLRAGDYYGHSVNLASRVTGVARPDSVLCTQEVRDAAADDYEWSFAGKHRLKGVSDSLALHRARPLEARSDGEGDGDRDGHRQRSRRHH
jgi:adenylate cyclase